jgi:hypothetical protein
VLASALVDVGLGPRLAPARTAPVAARAAARVARTRRGVARAWLLRELEREVACPVAVACAAVGIDPDVLAAAVRARARP